MYNRYLRNDDGVYTRMPMQDAPRGEPPRDNRPPPPPPSGGNAPPPRPPQGDAPPPPPPQGDPMGDLSSLLGGIDPGMIAKLLPVLSQLNRPESGETAAFLRALRPFLKPERQDKVERAAQLARFIHLGKTLLLSEGGMHDV